MKATRLLSEKDLRAEVKNQVLIACNFHRGVGRPAHSVLGGKAVQMSIDVCTDMIGMIIAQRREAGEVLETSIDYVGTPSGRREFAKRIIAELAGSRPGNNSPVAAERLKSRLGLIIKVGLIESPVANRKIGTYVATAGAYPMEMQLAWGLRRKMHAQREATFSKLDEDFIAAMPTLREGVSFEESTAQAVLAYQMSNAS
jgi:hypothetical protein